MRLGFELKCLTDENCGVSLLCIKGDGVCLRLAALGIQRDLLRTSFLRLSEAGAKDSAKIGLALLVLLDVLA